MRLGQQTKVNETVREQGAQKNKGQGETMLVFEWVLGSQCQNSSEEDEAVSESELT